MAFVLHRGRGMRNDDYMHILDTIQRHHTPSIERRLRRAFGRACVSHIEDAIGNAFTDALARPAPFLARWQRHGEAGLVRFFYHVAWRHLRAYFRKKASRCEIPSGELLGMMPEIHDTLTPYVIASSRETEAITSCLVEEAAERFGGGRRRSLGAALRERLGGGTDTEAARAHAVPREYVNRAKRWIGTQLTDGPRPII